MAKTESENPVFEPHPAPVDGEGFVASYAPDDVAGILGFFEEYGFVVVHNVLSKEECQRTIDEIWDSFPEANRNDPKTWEQKTMDIGRYGIVGGGICSGPCAWANRQNPNVHKAFSAVSHTEKLLTVVDRYGVMKPVRGINIDSTLVDRPDWQTQSAWIHWDLNPWAWTNTQQDPETDWIRTDDDLYEEDIMKWSDPFMATHNQFMIENNARARKDYGDHFDKLQGLVALSDSREQDGGFLTVPGFHKFLPQWTAKTKRYLKSNFVMAPKEDTDIQPHAQRISMRAGSLVIWSGSLPHCNFPSESDKFRFCQYIRMFPPSILPPSSLREDYFRLRAERVRENLPPSFEPSELGRKVFGLDPWE